MRDIAYILVFNALLTMNGSLFVADSSKSSRAVQSDEPAYEPKEVDTKAAISPRPELQHPIFHLRVEGRR